ncbi:MAG: hypothetical protein QG614_552 [Patescibacteria group bacterium]|nr:hypothetical protein [Patescibacteria group bacterium]
MLKEKKTFFERLSGAITVEDQDEPIEIEASYEDYEDEGRKSPLVKEDSRSRRQSMEEYDEEEEEEGELSVDVYQTETDLIIEAMVAGVKPDDLHLSITRDMVTIKGKRDGNNNVDENDYFYRELYWGNFSRTILLPHEIDIEGAEAVEKHGLLIIRMPKLDKGRAAKLKVKSI